jgi:hypothetical protein
VKKLGSHQVENVQALAGAALEDLACAFNEIHFPRSASPSALAFSLVF